MNDQLKYDVFEVGRLKTLFENRQPTSHCACLIRPLRDVHADSRLCMPRASAHCVRQLAPLHSVHAGPCLCTASTLGLGARPSTTVIPWLPGCGRPLIDQTQLHTCVAGLVLPSITPEWGIEPLTLPTPPARWSGPTQWPFGCQGGPSRQAQPEPLGHRESRRWAAIAQP